MLKTIVTAWLLLFIGDLLSTFCYHVPEHVFGKLHLKVHHSPNKNFRHYAVLSSQPTVILDGVLGVLPYVLLAILFWSWSPVGVTIGLVFGQFHVWWRHTTALHWQTPRPLIWLCRLLLITTPERHWQHHKNTSSAYGDIFTVFERPARLWLLYLRRLRANRRCYLASAS